LTILHAVLDFVLILELCFIFYYFKSEKKHYKSMREMTYSEIYELNKRVANLEYKEKEREAFGK